MNSRETLAPHAAPARAAATPSLAAERPTNPQARLQRALGNQAIQTTLRQGTLSVEPPSNPEDQALEREADSIADLAQDRFPATTPHFTGPASRPQTHPTTELRGLGPAPDAPPTASASASAPQGPSSSVREAIGSPAHPLEPHLRADMESRFGADFGPVLIHTDITAQRSAQARNALAYTVGRHVVFAHGRYAPYQRDGRRLLAHELAHVLQQRHGRLSTSSTLERIQRQAAPPSPASTPPLTERYDAAIREKRWTDAAVLLNGFNDADIQAHVLALSPADRTALRQATPDWAHRVRAPLLDLDYNDAVGAGNWVQAAVFLNGFNAADIASRIARLSSAQRLELYVGAPEWAAPVLDAVAAADLPAAFKGAVRRGTYERAAVLLNGFNDADIQAHVLALSPADRTALRQATPDWAHRVRAPLLDLDYNDAVGAGNWAQAAVFLNGFSAADIASRIARLSSAQRLELYVGAPEWAAPVLDAVAAADLPAAFKGAVRRGTFERAAVLLNGFNDADIQAHVLALSPADRTALRQATPDWAHRVRAPLLHLDFTAAVSGGNWEQAAVLLNGFNDADIQAHVLALSAAERTALRQATPDWAHRVRAPLLDLEFNDAVAANDWPRAALMLNGFNDADIASRLAALTPAQRTQLMAAARQHAALGGGSRLLAAGRASGGPGAGEVFGTINLAQTVNSAAAPGGTYSSVVTITFTPNPAVCDATQIGFVQTVRIVNTGTNVNRDIIPGQKDRLNPNQEAVDRVHGMKHGWYGLSNTATTLANLTLGSSPSPLIPAVLRDRPSWNQPNLTWEFETAAIARSGPQANLVYSVIHWGFTVDANNLLTAAPVRKEDRTSAGFGTAVEAWNKQATGPASGQSAPDQQPLPAFQ